MYFQYQGFATKRPILNNADGISERAILQTKNTDHDRAAVVGGRVRGMVAAGAGVEAEVWVEA